MKPIMFKKEMIEAILAGRKSMTRRIVKPTPAKRIKEFLPADPSGFWGFDGDEPVQCIHSPYGEAGDHLYIKTSRFMPKAKSPAILEITGIRVERLQDISEKDCFAEGVERRPDYEKQTPTINGQTYGRDEFKKLWNSIHGKGAWEINPFVFVIEFKKVEA